MTVKGVEAIPRKYPAFEPEKVTPAEMKGMGLPEAQAGVELLGEEFCIAKVRRKGAVSVRGTGQLRPFPVCSCIPAGMRGPTCTSLGPT